MHTSGGTALTVVSSLAPVDEHNQPCALNSCSDSFSSHSSTNNGKPIQILPRYVLTGKTAAEVMQAQLQPLATNHSAASQLLAPGQRNAKVLQHDSYGNPADKKKQKLAKNRATAALSRERKKAHLDVLQQRVSLLERTNSALNEQLALRESEVLQLKSRLGDIAGTNAQDTKLDPVPEAEKIIQPHTVLNAVSALPRIYCSVANPPSSSCPHQPSQAAAPPPHTLPVQVSDTAEEEQQLECKLEHSMSCDLHYQPVTIKPELQEQASHGHQTQRAVITSGHFHVFSTAAVKSTCQPQPLATSTSHQHTDTTTQQHTSMAYPTDELGAHIPHVAIGAAELKLAAFRQLPVSDSQDWVSSSYDAGSYMYQNACDDMQDSTGVCQNQAPFLTGKAFDEQELMAWQLISPEQMQAGAHTTYDNGLAFPVHQSEPQCPDIGEADVMVRHQSGSSTPGPEDWDTYEAGKQQACLKLENAAGHGITWLAQELQEQMDGPGLDPTARIFDELEHLEPQATHCTQPAGIVCAV